MDKERTEFRNATVESNVQLSHITVLKMFPQSCNMAHASDIGSIYTWPGHAHLTCSRVSEQAMGSCTLHRGTGCFVSIVAYVRVLSTWLSTVHTKGGKK